MNRIIKGTSLGVVGVATFLSIATSRGFNEWSASPLEERVTLEQEEAKTFCVDATMPKVVSSFQVFASIAPLVAEEQDAEVDVPADLQGRAIMRHIGGEVTEQVELRSRGTNAFLAVGDALACEEELCVATIELTLESTLAEGTFEVDLSVGAAGIHLPEEDAPEVTLEMREGSCEGVLQ